MIGNDHDDGADDADQPEQDHGDHPSSERLHPMGPDEAAVDLHCRNADDCAACDKRNERDEPVRKLLQDARVHEFPSYDVFLIS
jgi:hypothetical protein